MHNVARLDRHARGLTLIELLVTVAIVVIVLGLGLPSFRDWMVAQRVTAVATELATDFRFAKSEALSGNSGAGVVFNNAGNGCYTVYRTVTNETGVAVVRGGCDCTRPSATICDAKWTNVKTLVLPSGGDVSISVPSGALREVYTTGARLVDEGPGLVIQVTGGGNRKLTVTTTSGLAHPKICTPNGSTISGFKPC
jgi:prepilin-type N-terminal cleavage/methylation domain-containing protein